MRRLWAFLAIVWLAASAVPSPVSAVEGKCQEPSASYRYTKTDMVYELVEDLAACEWWNGTSIVLDGFLARDYPGGDVALAVGLQGTDTSGHAICDDAVRATICRVSMRLEHPPQELMVYRGIIRYPWTDGQRARHLELTCHSAGDMADCRAGLASDAI